MKAIIDLIMKRIKSRDSVPAVTDRFEQRLDRLLKAPRTKDASHAHPPLFRRELHHA